MNYRTLICIFAMLTAAGCADVDVPALQDGQTADITGATEDSPAAASQASDSDVSDLEFSEPTVPGSEVDLAEAREIGEDLASTPAIAESAPDAPGDVTLAFRHEGAQEHAAEVEFLRLLNQERRNRGLNALKVYWDLEDDARSHSELMSSTNDLHHNPELSSVTLSAHWSRIGENVGRGPSVPSLHQAFLDSPDHFANVVGDFTHVGIGVVESSSLWVTFVFMKAKVTGLENTYGPFYDDDGTTHEENIHKIWRAGLTYGCGGTTYCPERTLTRGEMAAFLTRALNLPATSRDYFDDDDGAWYETSANAMYEAGITRGCTERNYCGGEAVTRGQMAVFLQRAFDYESSGRDHFRDDDGAFYEDAANALHDAGITYGCRQDEFCGSESLTRAEMASFLARALKL